MAMFLWVAFLSSTVVHVLATECLMIGKVYEAVSKQMQENVISWEECALLCNQTVACSFFTFQPESAFKNACWMMEDSPPSEASLVDDPYAISGSKACLAQRPKSLRPCPEPGVFYEDKLLPDPHLWTATWQLCQAKCASHKTCKMFNWKQDTTPNGGCWMLPSNGTQFTQFHKDRYTISGLAKCDWETVTDTVELEAKAGEQGKVILDCRANHTLYNDMELPAPKMYLEKWEDCQAACDSSDACEAYSFKSDTTPKGGCWLFRTLKYGTKIADDKAITGRKWCKIPSTSSGTVGVQAPAPVPANPIPVTTGVSSGTVGVQAPAPVPANPIPVTTGVSSGSLGAQAPVTVTHPVTTGVSSGNPTKSSTGGPNYIWLILCACFLAMACCFGFLCLAFRQRKSPKKRAVEVESSDEERPVLAAAPAPPVASVAPPAAVPLVAPQAPPPVTYYRVKPMSARPPLLEPSEPVADRA
eukprot:symbB.v1.2.020849.t1/scaffold1711.1/size185425/12